jgi:hypothetical protein
VISVTTALSVIEKPALLGWAAKCATERLRELVEPGRGYTREELDSLLDEARGAYRAARAKAKDSGHMVAEWIEHHIAGRDVPRPEEPGAAAGVEAFLAWEEDTGVEWLASEWAMADPSTLVGGRADALAMIAGRPVLLDVKRRSGKARTYREDELQVSAYLRIAFAAGLVRGAKETDVARAILIVPADGGAPVYAPVETAMEDEWGTVLAAARLRQGVPCSYND